MAIQIEFFERTGPSAAPITEPIDNNNWKREDLRDSLYKYYYYPIKRPEGTINNLSYSRYLFAKISGLYPKIKRLRWKISNINTNKNVKFMFGQSNIYTTPTNSLHPLVTPTTNVSEIYLYPNYSTISPTQATEYLSNLEENGTYYTDFIISQLWVGDGPFLGNVDPLTFEIELEEYLPLP